MTVRRPASIFELPEVRRLLMTVARRRYSARQLREIARGWRRDLDALLARKGRHHG